jgi:hypothetical protein
MGKRQRLAYAPCHDALGLWPGRLDAQARHVGCYIVSPSNDPYPVARSYREFKQKFVQILTGKLHSSQLLTYFLEHAEVYRIQTVTQLFPLKFFPLYT